MGLLIQEAKDGNGESKLRFLKEFSNEKTQIISKATNVK